MSIEQRSAALTSNFGGRGYRKLSICCVLVAPSAAAGAIVMAVQVVVGTQLTTFG